MKEQVDIAAMARPYIEAFVTAGHDVVPVIGAAFELWQKVTVHPGFVGWMEAAAHSDQAENGWAKFLLNGEVERWKLLLETYGSEDVEALAMPFLTVLLEEDWGLRGIQKEYVDREPVQFYEIPDEIFARWANPEDKPVGEYDDNESFRLQFQEISKTLREEPKVKQFAYTAQHPSSEGMMEADWLTVVTVRADGKKSGMAVNLPLDPDKREEFVAILMGKGRRIVRVGAGTQVELLQVQVMEESGLLELAEVVEKGAMALGERMNDPRVMEHLNRLRGYVSESTQVINIEWIDSDGSHSPRQESVIEPIPVSVLLAQLYGSLLVEGATADELVTVNRSEGFDSPEVHREVMRVFLEKTLEANGGDDRKDVDRLVDGGRVGAVASEKDITPRARLGMGSVGGVYSLGGDERVGSGQAISLVGQHQVPRRKEVQGMSSFARKEKAVSGGESVFIEAFEKEPSLADARGILRPSTDSARASTELSRTSSLQASSGLLEFVQPGITQVTMVEGGVIPPLAKVHDVLRGSNGESVSFRQSGEVLMWVRERENARSAVEEQILGEVKAERWLDQTGTQEEERPYTMWRSDRIVVETRGVVREVEIPVWFGEKVGLHTVWGTRMEKVASKAESAELGFRFEASLDERRAILRRRDRVVDIRMFLAEQEAKEFGELLIVLKSGIVVQRRLFLAQKLPDRVADWLMGRRRFLKALGTTKQKYVHSGLVCLMALNLFIDQLNEQILVWQNALENAPEKPERTFVARISLDQWSQFLQERQFGEAEVIYGRFGKLRLSPRIVEGDGLRRETAAVLAKRSVERFSFAQPLFLHL